MSLLFASVLSLTASTAYAEERGYPTNTSSVENQQTTVQHAQSPDGLRSIDALGFQGGAAVSKIHLVSGDRLQLSKDKRTITWISGSGELVAYLDATSGGRTPTNSFEISGDTVKLFGISERSACGQSYAGAAVFGVSWELGVCTPLGVAFLPAGVVCGVGTALVSPLIPWDNVCK